MPDQGGTPLLWLEFDEHGAIDAGTAKQLTALLNKPGIEDLVVMAHGWKNDKKDAARLYGTFWKNACANFAAGKAEGIIVAGAQWPAKAFRTDFDAAALAAVDTGGALAVAPGGAAVTDLSQQDFESLLTGFNSFMGPSGATTVTAARTAAKALTASASQAPGPKLIKSTIR